MAGLGLAAVGILLFLLIYFGMGGVAALPRLLLALCIPPLLLAVGVGGYWLYTQSKK
jgi:hypothetical protein